MQVLTSFKKKAAPIIVAGDRYVNTDSDMTKRRQVVAPPLCLFAFPMIIINCPIILGCSISLSDSSFYAFPCS